MNFDIRQLLGHMTCSGNHAEGPWHSLERLY